MAVFCPCGDLAERPGRMVGQFLFSGVAGLSGMCDDPGSHASAS